MMTDISEIIKKITPKCSFNKVEEEQLKEHEVQMKLAQIIISSSDPEELKNKIIKEVAIALKASRCFLLEYDVTTNVFKKVTNSYCTARSCLNNLGYDYERNLLRFSLKQKYLKSKVIEDTEKFVKENNLKDKPEDLYFKEYDVKSILVVRLEFGEVFLGVLVVEYDEKKPNLKKYDLVFLTHLAEHISIALYLSKLYSKEKAEKEKEILLRSIISIMSFSYDLSEIVTKIFEILSKIYNIKDIYLDLSLNGVKEFYSYNGITSNIPCSLTRDELISIYLQGSFDHIRNLDYYVPKSKNFVLQNNLENSEIEEFFDKNDIKAFLLMPIDKEDIHYGCLIVHFNKENPLSSLDLDFIKTIGQQLAIAINQVSVFKAQKRKAERESLARKILGIVRSTFDLDNIKSEVVNQLGEHLKADRVFFADYDSKLKKYSISKRGEYLSSDEVSSLKGFDFTSVPGFIENVRAMHVAGKDVVINDIYKDFDIKNAKELISFFDKEGFRSYLAVNIEHGGVYLGNVVVSYRNQREFTEEEANFIKVIAEQSSVAIYQASLYKETELNAKNERTLRKVIEILRSSLDLKEVKSKIVNEIGEIFNADRCYFRSYDGIKNKFLAPDVEYLSPSGDLKSLINQEIDQVGLEYFMSEVKRLKNGFYPVVVNKESVKGTPVEGYLDGAGIIADYAMPIIDRQEEVTWLVLHYSKKDPNFDENTKRLLETIAYQIDIAFEQIRLYNNVKLNAQTERTLRTVIESSRKSLILNDVLSDICGSLTDLFEVDRVSIAKLNSGQNGENISVFEHRASNEVQLAKDNVSFVLLQQYWKEYMLKGQKIKAIDNIPESDLPNNMKEIYNSMGIKALVWVPLYSKNTNWGGLLLAEYKSFRVWTDEQIDLLEAISNQIYIAIRQSEMFEKQKQATQKEITLRKTMNIISSTLNSEEIKKYFVEIILGYFKADRCLFAEFDRDLNKFIPFKIEKLRDSSLETLVGIDPEKEMPEFVTRFKKSKNIVIKDLKKILSRKNFDDNKSIQILKAKGVKSAYGLSVNYKGKLMGILAIEFAKDKNALTYPDLEFLRLLRDQVGVALYQAELYEQIQIQAVREKAGRSLVEVLRSTIDKKAIKHLFVRNIGKYLKADFVFFADYDFQNKMYLPVEEGDEYLPDSSQKSFVGYDWSDPLIREYLQPIFEKRELMIPSIDKYFELHRVNDSFANLFTSRNIQSSYNIPVIYQDRILGCFCIEFVKTERHLDAEDMKSLRNICAQAAIALYQADLYVQAQESSKSKGDFITNISNDLKQPLDNIIGFSDALIKHSLDINKQLEYINVINENCKLLFDLRNDILNIAKIESDSFNLNYSDIEMESLIVEVKKSLKELAESKGINIQKNLVQAYLHADREQIYQVFYNILSAAIRVTPENGRIIIRTEVEDGKFITSIEEVGEGLEIDDLNAIFQTFKKIDTSFPLGQKDSSLGLATAKKIIELHKGTINVDSTDDKGTCLCFILPKAVALDE